MAEEETTAEDTGAEKGKGKGKLLVVGGFVAVIAAGAVAAMMAIPATKEKPRMAGPFSIPLFEDQFICNINENSHTRFLTMEPQASYYAYDPLYLGARVLDQLYPPALEDSIFRLLSRMSIEEIYGKVNESTLGAALRDVLDPVLFPVHIGETKLPWDVDEVSGLRPGLSSDKNTFRGAFEDHLLHIDSSTHELWVDDGPKTKFDEGDYDVRIITSKGEVLFVDVSYMKKGFDGEVKVGVRGRIQRVTPVGLKVQ